MRWKEHVRVQFKIYVQHIFSQKAALDKPNEQSTVTFVLLVLWGTAKFQNFLYCMPVNWLWWGAQLASWLVKSQLGKRKATPVRLELAVVGLTLYIEILCRRRYLLRHRDKRNRKMKVFAAFCDDWTPQFCVWIRVFQCRFSVKKRIKRESTPVGLEPTASEYHLWHQLEVRRAIHYAREPDEIAEFKIKCEHR